MPKSSLSKKQILRWEKREDGSIVLSLLLLIFHRIKWVWWEKIYEELSHSHTHNIYSTDFFFFKV